MKKVYLGISILFLFFFCNLVGAQSFKTQMTFYGGVNHHFEYGSIDDYEPGYNNFPVMPSHTPRNIGFIFAHFFTPSLGMEIDTRLTSGSPVTLVDPSDLDTVDIDTSNHLSLTLNVVYQFLTGSFRPYILVGGGFDRMSGKDEIYVSEYGYEIVMNKLLEDEGFDPMINAGGGVIYFFKKNIGIRMDLRYVWIFDSPFSLNTLSLGAGICFRL